MKCKECDRLWEVKGRMVSAKFLFHYQTTHGISAQTFIQIMNTYFYEFI